MKSNKKRLGVFPEPMEEESRKEKLARIKRMVQEKDGISDEKLDSVLAKLIDSVEHD